MPAMTGPAENEEPVPRKVSSSTKPSGCFTSASLPGARRLLMLPPGAVMSGLRTPSPLLASSPMATPVVGNDRGTPLR